MVFSVSGKEDGLSLILSMTHWQGSRHRYSSITMDLLSIRGIGYYLIRSSNKECNINLSYTFAALLQNKKHWKDN